MTNGVIRVATRRNVPARRRQGHLRAQIVEELPVWSGSNRVVRLRKLKTRTTILTAPSPTAGRSAPSLVVRGVGIYDLVSDEDVAKALAADINVDMRDDPGKDWVWMTDKD